MDLEGIREIILNSNEHGSDFVAQRIWECYLLWLRVTACLLICLIQFFVELPFVILFYNWDINVEVILCCVVDVFSSQHFRAAWNTYVIPCLPRMQVYKICKQPDGEICLLTRKKNMGRWKHAVEMLYHPWTCELAWSFSYAAVRVVVYPVVKFVLVYLLILCRGM